ncbi:MAG: hypothetical protein L6Q81_11100 [Bacteroidia bacterium]|nr:hypothetical protein [Bacteroidia bacterium]
MKLLLPALAFSFMSFAIDGTKDTIGVPGPIIFNQTTFELIKSDRPRDNYYEQYYLPVNQTLDSFRQQMTVFVFDSAWSPEAAADFKIKQLIERKKSDDVCNYQKTVHKEKGEYMVDFTTGETQGKYLLSHRFNILRYKKISLGKKRDGLLIYGYCAQQFLDSITSYYKTFRTERVARLNEIGATVLPVIKLDSK